ncbi:type IV secretory system conjugative DNA transfer family protein [Microlunatus elymi]|uniref:Type IV secretory system conjugative DNA transfer family protein n=1 Tax=Microlunatus elymi TaxID=2596828 RepID=A0A516PVY0_9ACTN|nr:TraM recognition domain-containing protein [Microlunatus elymi]QDP95346.1 type IV secretory system conjugative DNA transfer family protein [Microlunatus elymi]
MWRWYAAEDRRQAAAVVALLIMVGLFVAAMTPVLAGVGLARIGRQTPGRWSTLAATVWLHPGRATATFGIGIGSGTFWVLAIALLCLVSSAYVWTAMTAYRLAAPTGRGFATRSDLAQELSVSVCRKRARTTRPDLGWRDRRLAAPAQVGIPLHRSAVGRSALWLPLENATGVIAPQQSGKTLMDQLHKVIAAPGSLIVTSTKLDLFLLTAKTRQRAGSAVQVLDLTGSAKWPDLVRWNPVRGCTTVKSAKRRAQALLRATTGEGHDGTVGNHAFFERRAVAVLTAYLLAAGISGAPLMDFVGWCQNDLDTEAAAILRTRPDFTAVRRTLQQAQSVVEETRSGIWETIRDAIACLTDPDVAASALPRTDAEGLYPEAFVRSGGTVYVIGSEDDAASQAPLITAFVQDVLDTARRLAIADSNASGRERLAPPFTAVLDEVASICPLPDLPDTLSDSAGRGVIVHYALQSPAQAQARWGRAAATLFDNTTALTILGGLKSEETLKWASLLAGRRLEERRSRQSHGFADPGSIHVGVERSDILEPAAIRELPRGRALLIMRSMPPTIVRLVPAWTRRDWKQLRADADALRAGRVDDEPQLSRPAFTGELVPR